MQDDDLPIYEETVGWLRFDPLPPGPPPQESATASWFTDPWASEQQTQPVAATAGEQNHSDPWVFAGADAPAPVDVLP